MSKTKDALYDLINKTEIGYTWKDFEFYINGKISRKTDLRPDITRLLNLLEECYPSKGDNRAGKEKPEQLGLILK